MAGERRMGYGEPWSVGNFTLCRYRESVGDIVMDYLSIKPSGRHFEVKIYADGLMYGFLMGAYAGGDDEVVKMVCRNIFFASTAVDVFYHNAHLLLATVSSNPFLLEEGYEDSVASHDMVKALAEDIGRKWLDAFKGRMSSLSSESGSSESAVDEAAEVASGIVDEK